MELLVSLSFCQTSLRTTNFHVILERKINKRGRPIFDISVLISGGGDGSGVLVLLILCPRTISCRNPDPRGGWDDILARLFFSCGCAQAKTTGRQKLSNSGLVRKGPYWYDPVGIPINFLVSYTKTTCLFVRFAASRQRLTLAVVLSNSNRNARSRPNQPAATRINERTDLSLAR
jgi:hypothetical protein